MVLLKKCNKCKIEKPETSEYFHKNGKDRFRGICKDCRNKSDEDKKIEWNKKRDEIYKTHFVDYYEKGILTKSDISKLLGVSDTAIYKTFKKYNIKTKFIEQVQNILNNDECVVITKKEPTSKDEQIEYFCKVHGVRKNTIEQINRNSGCDLCVNYKYALKLCKLRNLELKTTFIQRESDKIIVSCKEHGDIETTIQNLKQTKCGCFKCFLNTHTNECGWDAPFHVEKNKSMYLKSKCQVYIVKLTSEDESFYKIGISKNIENRRKYFPYECDVLCLYETNRYNAVFIERNLHRYHKKYKYMPKKDFGGKTECFSKVLLKKGNKS